MDRKNRWMVRWIEKIDENIDGWLVVRIEKLYMKKQMDSWMDRKKYMKKQKNG